MKVQISKLGQNRCSNPKEQLRGGQVNNHLAENVDDLKCKSQIYDTSDRIECSSNELSERYYKLPVSSAADGLQADINGLTVDEVTIVEFINLLSKKNSGT